MNDEDRHLVWAVAAAALVATIALLILASIANAGEVRVSFKMPACQWDAHAGEYVCRSGMAMCDSLPTPTLTDLRNLRVLGRRFGDRADSLLGIVSVAAMEGRWVTLALDVRCGAMGVVGGELEDSKGKRWPLEQWVVFALPWDGRLPR